MKKKFIVLVGLGIIFGAYTISSLPLHGLPEWCESKGGRWSEPSKFCDKVDGFSCTVSGGKYDGCDDHFVYEDGTVQLSPAAMCMQTCQFGLGLDSKHE